MLRLFLLFSLLLAGCAPSPLLAQSAPERPAGHLLIVGGGRQPDELVAHFVALAGGPGRARIAVLPMASGDAAEAGREKVEQLREFGAEAFSLDLTRAQAESDSVAALLDGATGVWFPGGDQARLTRALLDTPVLEAIRRRYREGAVIGGTSAGAAVMSDSMITGQQRRPGVDTLGYYGDEFPSVARGAIHLAPGFGLLPGALVDQHFLRRERHNRLLAATLERPRLLGVGIDESTALQVGPDGTWTVVGESAVLVFDAREARVTAGSAPVLGAAGVRLHLLPAGSAFDPATGTARLPDDLLSPIPGG
jgi:cyanophycinase